MAAWQSLQAHRVLGMTSDEYVRALKNILEPLGYMVNSNSAPSFWFSNEDILDADSNFSVGRGCCTEGEAWLSAIEHFVRHATANR